MLALLRDTSMVPVCCWIVCPLGLWGWEFVGAFVPLSLALSPEGREDQRAVGLGALRDCGVVSWLGCLLDSRLRGNDLRVLGMG